MFSYNDLEINDVLCFLCKWYKAIVLYNFFYTWNERMNSFPQHISQYSFTQKEVRLMKDSMLLYSDQYLFTLCPMKKRERNIKRGIRKSFC